MPPKKRAETPADVESELKCERGVVARCGNGYLGLITEGPKKIVVAGEPKELFTGIHLADQGNRKIGDHWASWQPTPICRIAEWLA
jgi:hypothetical protein